MKVHPEELAEANEGDPGQASEDGERNKAGRMRRDYVAEANAVPSSTVGADHVCPWCP